MSDNNNKKYGDSDDDRYFYQHYQNKDYYSDNDNFAQFRMKVDIFLWLLMVVLLIIF
ncbi:MAG: hypothetical protein K6G87_00550 [Butyrivibrio sp.]|uniref:hypothetical protein n=1 Tax=Butyrivibrio sp. TaxID=28121 RepID=UPI0025FED9BC|nr:hypothetical protein [Butyrivibrio sp.]MCR5769700.1 hypothetical protein [Butyrivibrio sp.]